MNTHVDSTIAARLMALPEIFAKPGGLVAGRAPSLGEYRNMQPVLGITTLRPTSMVQRLQRHACTLKDAITPAPDEDPEKPPPEVAALRAALVEEASSTLHDIFEMALPPGYMAEFTSLNAAKSRYMHLAVTQVVPEEALGAFQDRLTLAHDNQAAVEIYLDGEMKHTHHMRAHILSDRPLSRDPLELRLILQRAIRLTYAAECAEALPNTDLLTALLSLQLLTVYVVYADDMATDLSLRLVLTPGPGKEKDLLLRAPLTLRLPGTDGATATMKIWLPFRSPTQPDRGLNGSTFYDKNPRGVAMGISVTFQTPSAANAHQVWLIPDDNTTGRRCELCWPDIVWDVMAYLDRHCAFPDGKAPAAMDGQVQLVPVKDQDEATIGDVQTNLAILVLADLGQLHHVVKPFSTQSGGLSRTTPVLLDKMACSDAFIHVCLIPMPGDNDTVRRQGVWRSHYAGTAIQNTALAEELDQVVSARPPTDVSDGRFPGAGAMPRRVCAVRLTPPSGGRRGTRRGTRGRGSWGRGGRSTATIDTTQPSPGEQAATGADDRPGHSDDLAPLGPTGAPGGPPASGGQH